MRDKYWAMYTDLKFKERYYCRYQTHHPSYQIAPTVFAPRDSASVSHSRTQKTCQ